MLLAANRKILNWRSFEREGALESFGTIKEVSHSDIKNDFNNITYIRWFPNSEDISISDWDTMISQRHKVPEHIKHINDPFSFKFVHDKIACFDEWKSKNILIPNYFEFTSKKDFYDKYNRELPILIRLNNGVAGQDSFLATSPSEVETAVDSILKLQSKQQHKKTRCLAVEYICTINDAIGPFNVSYRVIVSGEKIVTGYARCSPKEDWVAVTNKFSTDIMGAWFDHNILLQDIMVYREKEIVDAVKVLGLNHQGIDIIPKFSTDGIDLYFLEVQTTYDAGFINAGPYTPPYYNPYNPILVNFIKQNDSKFAEKLPLYYYNWLDKRAHFRKVYENIIL